MKESDKIAGELSYTNSGGFSPFFLLQCFEIVKHFPNSDCAKHAQKIIDLEHKRVMGKRVITDG